MSRNLIGNLSGVKTSGGNPVTIDATNGQTNAGINIKLAGTGSFSLGPPPDNTATGGNSRGTNAVDLQVSRTAASHVASGLDTFLCGTDSFSSANYSVVIGGRQNAGGGDLSVTIGSYNVVSANSNVAIGASHNLSGPGSIAIGAGGSDRGSINKLCVAFGTINYNAGDRQLGTQVLSAKTSSTTATRLTADGNAAGTSNVGNLTPSSARYVMIEMIGKDIATAGNAQTWSAAFLLDQGANAASTSLTQISTPVTARVGAAAATVSVTADTTNGGINLTVSPPNADQWYWSAAIRSTEVG